ncbi:MAG: hypothetical protein IPJ65_14070 [Archangiaceae bacterium]|nr:hypothetical protein [Archangiaceae bacterium]
MTTPRSTSAGRFAMPSSTVRAERPSLPRTQTVRPPVEYAGRRAITT